MTMIFLPVPHGEDRRQIDIAMAERAVAEERLAAAEVLQVHVADDRKEVLDDLHRVGAALLQLAIPSGGSPHESKCGLPKP